MFWHKGGAFWNPRDPNNTDLNIHSDSKTRIYEIDMWSVQVAKQKF
jgi:hypothetical protein